MRKINGLLSGAVAICAAANVVRPWSALIIGVIGGLFHMLASFTMMKLQLDDPLDATAVHLASGFWGLIAQPIFAYDTGIVYGYVIFGAMSSCSRGAKMHHPFS